MSLGGVSATTGLLCLVIAGIMWWAADRWHPRVIVALVITGMSGLAGSAFGAKLHDVAVYVDQWVGQFIGQYTGAAFSGIVALVVLALVVVAMWKDRVTAKTLVAAMFVPVTVVMIPGMVGQVGASAVTGLASAVGSIGGALFGIH
jgi:hypothetical protein